jgi:hypothetical protein
MWNILEQCLNLIQMMFLLLLWLLELSIVHFAGSQILRMFRSSRVNEQFYEQISNASFMHQTESPTEIKLVGKSIVSEMHTKLLLCCSN